MIAAICSYRRDAVAVVVQRYKLAIVQNTDGS